MKTGFNARIVRAGVLGMLVTVLTFGLSVIGCASAVSAAPAAFSRTNPFQTDSSVIIRVKSEGTVNFINKNGDDLKVNGVNITSNEFILPGAPSYEFKFRVNMINRGLLGGLSKSEGKAQVDYAFEQGKTYLIVLREPLGSRVGAAFIGAFLPASFEMVLYEYTTEDLNDKNKIKLKEFSVEKIDSKEF